MPIGNLIVIGFIVAVFCIFLVVLAAVSWWSEQTPRRGAAKVAREPAHPGTARLHS